MVDQWYVPINDLHNIFIEYYGDDRGITPNLISTCSLMLLAGRIAEQELGAAIYPIEVIRAPLFLDILQDYYLGGINDMAAWTQIIGPQPHPFLHLPNATEVSPMLHKPKRKCTRV